MIYYSTWKEACNSVSQTTPSSDILKGREIGRKIFNITIPRLPPLNDTLICLDYITTNNILALRQHWRQKRIQKHNDGTGAKSTRGRKWRLLYAEVYFSRSEAMSREWYLKRNHEFRKLVRPD